MDKDEVEMELLAQEPSYPDQYQPLVQLLQNRHFATFKSLLGRALARQGPAGLDVNRVLGHPVNMSLLELAATENYPEFVALLLERGAEPNQVNPEHERAALHFAAERANAAALEQLLRHPRIKPNLEAAHSTALHYAVKAGCHRCVSLLLESGASPNIPNNRGLTALHFAADKGNRGLVELIVNNCPMLILDTYRDRKKETARMAIEKKFPDIELPDESKSPDASNLLRYYLGANDEENFLATLKQVEDLDSLDDKAAILRLAVEKNQYGPMLELIGRGALDASELPQLGVTAIKHAYPEILQEVLSRNRKLADRFVMPVSQQLGVPATPGPGYRNNRLECFKIVLGDDDSAVNIRQEDDKGNSPLHYAARAECREALEMLLRRGAFIGHTNHFGATPLAHIGPKLLEAHLDECLSSSNERTEEYEIIMNYRNLEPHASDCGDELLLLGQQQHKRGSLSELEKRPAKPRSETEALLYIAKHKHLQHLLKHPLLSSFLYLKYLRISPVLYVNFALYSVFFVILNLYIYFVAANSPKLSSESNSTSEGDAAMLDNDKVWLRNWENNALLSVLLSLSLCYIVGRELMQLVSSPLHYLSSPENWVELALAGLTAWLLLGWSLGREVGACAVLLATWELVCLIAQHPRMSTDIEMFKTVTVNFTRSLLLYIFLILAFAYSFFVLFEGDASFPSVAGSLFKTIVMLTGEFDSAELPFPSYPLLSRLIFVGFIFLVVIILLNLLNGLAVNDTGEILAEAELVGLRLRTKLVAYAERVAVGQPFVPASCCCCLPSGGGLGACLQRGLGRAPMRFLARRILLFPRYLPAASLGVKPLKNYEIRLPGRDSAGPSSLAMDKLTVARAKAILQRRAQQRPDQHVINRLARLDHKIDELAAMVQRLVQLANNGSSDQT